jgi:DNA mismatch repair protein MutS
MTQDNLTPLMRQYWEVKSAHPDKVVLFRMGDFFEMFHDDAITAAPILGIALTRRNKKSADETPMCGVPHHSIAGPIHKLLQAGHKVAICEQIEDPKLAKGIVKRAVTRILSPGMVYDPDTLQAGQTNYICSFERDCLACLEASTGEAFYFDLVDNPGEQIAQLLRVLHPAEVLLAQQPSTVIADELVSGQVLGEFHVTQFVAPPSGAELERWLAQHPGLPTASVRLSAYAVFMQGPEILATLGSFERRQNGRHLQLSPTVIRHLELFETYKGEKRGSLFNAIDRTQTSSGCRLLKNWLSFPLRDRGLIEARLQQVETWVMQPPRLREVRALLARLGDIERRLGKIANPGCSGRDLVSLADSLQIGLTLSHLAGAISPGDDAIRALVHEIEITLVEEPPFSTRLGQMIRTGVRKDLDELIELADHSQQALLDLEQREKQATGISSLKVRYNQVFGYYIEITNTHKDKAPRHYHRKQTLANAERFITDELSDLERRILAAKTRRAEMEYEVYEQLRAQVLKLSPLLMRLAHQGSELDVITSLAWLALEQRYIRPQFFEDMRVCLEASRHPVVEQEVQTAFVPNHLNLQKGQCLLLTGPNMAGKSTLMRQVAVTVIMAQMGSFVAAERAELGVFEQLFTRIGASDFISEGLSTFMVEMQETAEMLASANSRSLVLLDEVGRGTSTYDGMSLAQAILEYLLETKNSVILFATHYHELTQLATVYPQVENAHMAIREKEGQIFFLHTLTPGPALRSYGIHVARLAGLPKAVTTRAASVLKELENRKTVSNQMAFHFVEPEASVELAPEVETHLKHLRELNVMNLTPLEALNQIVKWQQSLS